MIDDSNHIILEDEKYPALRANKNDSFIISDEDVFFAKERYKLHQSSPEEGVDVSILKNYFFKKYGL